MELRQLSHFLAVAEERHFTRAAARVHLTQSSLSSSVRALERELGSDLFVRSTRQVELTEAGRALLPAARRAIAAAEDGRDAVAAVRGLLRGHLAIGAIQALGPLNLPGLIARFHRRHPAVTLRIHHVGAPELVRRTADGEIDLAIVDLPLGPQGNRVRAHTIATESLQLAVAAAEPIAHRSRIRLVDLADREFVEYRPDSSLRTSIDAHVTRSACTVTSSAKSTPSPTSSSSWRSASACHCCRRPRSGWQAAGRWASPPTHRSHAS